MDAKKKANIVSNTWVYGWLFIAIVMIAFWLASCGATESAIPASIATPAEALPDLLSKESQEIQAEDFKRQVKGNWVLQAFDLNSVAAGEEHLISFGDIEQPNVSERSAPPFLNYAVFYAETERLNEDGFGCDEFKSTVPEGLPYWSDTREEYRAGFPKLFGSSLSWSVNPEENDVYFSVINEGVFFPYCCDYDMGSCEDQLSPKLKFSGNRFQVVSSIENAFLLKDVWVDGLSSAQYYYVFLRR